MPRCCFILIGLLVAGTAQAQQRPPDIHNRIGAISDEVAVERLRLAGVENPRVVRREGSQIIVQGGVQGRETTLRMDAQRGGVTEAANPSVVLLAPGAAAARPAVTGRQLPERAIVANPALMRDVVRPSPQ